MYLLITDSKQKAVSLRRLSWEQSEWHFKHAFLVSRVSTYAKWCNNFTT